MFFKNRLNRMGRVWPENKFKIMLDFLLVLYLYVVWVEKQQRSLVFQRLSPDKIREPQYVVYEYFSVLKF